MIITTAAVLAGCFWSSNTTTYTAPPPREPATDSSGADGYHLTYLPESLLVEFEVPGDKPCSVRVELHKTPRAVIRMVVDSVFDPGQYSIKWDKLDSAGNRLSQGLYYYHYFICDKNYTKKLDYRRHWQ